MSDARSSTEWSTSIASERAWRSRLRTESGLAGARREVRILLRRMEIPDEVAADLGLAFSELTTNALQAADAGTTVTASVAVATECADENTPALHRVDIEVTNVGDPIPGRLQVSPSAIVARSSDSGRGLPIAARVGEVVVEGIVGGTRATCRRIVRLAGEAAT